MGQAFVVCWLCPKLSNIHIWKICHWHAYGSVECSYFDYWMLVIPGKSTWMYFDCLETTNFELGSRFVKSDLLEGSKMSFDDITCAKGNLKGDLRNRWGRNGVMTPLLLVNSLSTCNTFYLCKAYVGWSTTDRINDVGGFRMFSILKKACQD